MSTKSVIITGGPGDTRSWDDVCHQQVWVTAQESQMLRYLPNSDADLVMWRCEQIGGHVGWHEAHIRNLLPVLELSNLWLRWSDHRREFVLGGLCEQTSDVFTEGIGDEFELCGMRRFHDGPHEYEYRPGGEYPFTDHLPPRAPEYHEWLCRNIKQMPADRDWLP